MAKGGWVYIMANRYRGGMYVGVSADVIRRVYQHREGTGSAHVADFAKTRLVYVEHHGEIGTAIAREKLVKKWRREWKFALIEKGNPDWLDLWENGSGLKVPRFSQAPCQARGDAVGKTAFLHALFYVCSDSATAIPLFQTVDPLHHADCGLSLSQPVRPAPVAVQV